MKDSHAAARSTTSRTGIDALLRGIEPPLRPDMEVVIHPSRLEHDPDSATSARSEPLDTSAGSAPAPSRQCLTAGASFAALWSESGAADSGRTATVDPRDGLHNPTRPLVRAEAGHDAGTNAEAGTAAPADPRALSSDAGLGLRSVTEEAEANHPGSPSEQPAVGALTPPVSGYAGPYDRPSAIAEVPWYTAAMRPSRRSSIRRRMRRVLGRSR